MWHILTLSITNITSRECDTEVKSHALDHSSIAESFIHPLGSHSDKRKYELWNTHMRAITPEAANLFGVIVSSEQKRQTSALKSCSAWAGRGILTISPKNLVPPASKHECYQYLLHNTCTCSSQTDASPLPLVSDNTVPKEKKCNRSELWLWMWSKSVASFNWKCWCLCWIAVTATCLCNRCEILMASCILKTLYLEAEYAQTVCAEEQIRSVQYISNDKK